MFIKERKKSINSESAAGRIKRREEIIIAAGRFKERKKGRRNRRMKFL